MWHVMPSEYKKTKKKFNPTLKTHMWICFTLNETWQFGHDRKHALECLTTWHKKNRQRAKLKLLHIKSNHK